MWSSVCVAVVTLNLPYGGVTAEAFAFRPLDRGLLLVLLLIAIVYAMGTELAKRCFLNDGGGAGADSS